MVSHTLKRKVSGSNPLGNAREPPPSERRLFVTGRRLTLGVISSRINGLRGKGEYVMFRIDPAPREGLPCGIAAGAALASRGFRKHRVTPFFGLLPALRAANGGRNRARTKIARDGIRARTNIVPGGIRRSGQPCRAASGSGGGRQSIRCASTETVTTCHGMNLPLARSAVFAAASSPPQQGTSMRTTVRERMSFSRMISVSFAV